MAPSSSAAMPRYMSSTIASRGKQRPAVRPSSEVDDVELPRNARIAGRLPPPSPFAMSFHSFSEVMTTPPPPSSEIDANMAIFDDEAELQLHLEMRAALGSSPPHFNGANEEPPAFSDDDGLALRQAASSPRLDESGAALPEAASPPPAKKKRKHGKKKSKKEKIAGWVARQKAEAKAAEEVRRAANMPDSNRRVTRGLVKRKLASPPHALPPLKRPAVGRYNLRRR